MKHILYILIALAFSACSKPQKTPYLTLNPDTAISGTAELYLLNDDYSLFDRAIADKETNKLRFIKDTVPEGIYQLQVNKQPIATLLISGTFPFEINGHFNPSSTKITVNGNDATKTLWKCQSISQNLEKQIADISINIPDSIVATEFIKTRDSIYALINNALLKSSKDIKRLQKNYRSSLLPLLTAQLKAGNHYIFNRENEVDFVYETSNHLTELYPEYEPVKQFASEVNTIMSQNLFNSLTKEGRTLPSISIPNAWNQPVILDTLINKPTLLVLWKSEDKASRSITKQLMRWSRTFRAQGLQVCMVSFDDEKDEWLNAIKQDRLALLHLSDLLGDNSPVLSEFGLTSVPQLLLVDENKVVIKRSKELDELRPAIQQLMKN